MSDIALGGRAFEPSTFRPTWLRPAVIGAVVALHAAALSMLPYLASRAPERPRDVVLDVETVAPSPNEQPQTVAPEPLEAAAEPPSPPQASPLSEPPPPPVAEPPAPERAPPPVVEKPPQTPTPEPAARPPNAKPAPVELQPTRPPPRVQAPRAVEAKPEQPKPQPARPKRLEAQTKPERMAKVEAPAAESARPAASPSAPSSAGSQSAYISAMAAAIRSRLFYPPAARARGAKGVVGVAFTIGASGALASFAITRSSGDDVLDAAARALVQSAHFPPPPGGLAHVSTSFNYDPR
jgi:protein TonB